MKRKELRPDEVPTIIPTSHIIVPTGDENFTEETQIDFPYCPRCDGQAMVTSTVERGTSDSERVACPFCGGDFIRQGRIDSNFKSTSVPGIIGWLEEHPTERRTLRWVCSESVLETVKVALLGHLESHDFSKFYEKMEVCEIEEPFPLSSRSSKRKFFSAFTLQKSLKLMPPEVVSAEMPTLPKEYEKVESTEVSEKSLQMSPSCLAKIKEEWQNSENIVPKFSKRSLKNQMKNLSSQTTSTLKGLVTSSTRSKSKHEKNIVESLGTLWMPMRPARAKRSGTQLTKGSNRKIDRRGSNSKKKSDSSKEVKTVVSSKTKRVSDGL